MKKGNTLAEVLILIVIIGIIMINFIPALMKLDNGYAKLYRAAYTALDTLLTEVGDTVSPASLCGNIVSKFNTIGAATCANNVNPNFITSNGMEWGNILTSWSNTFQNSQVINIDVNGIDKPGIIDKDILQFRIFDDGVVLPEGATEWGYAADALWQRKIGTNALDSASIGEYSVTVDAQGYIYAIGTFNYSGTYDVGFLKFDSSGSLLWQKKIGRSGTSEKATQITTDDSGNVYVLIAQNGDVYGGQDCGLIKFDSNGNVIWNKKIGSTVADYPNGLAVDAAGDIYISGWTSINTYGSFDIFLLKVKGDGSALVWAKHIGGALEDAGNQVIVDSSGNIYLSAYAYSNSSGANDPVIIKLAQTPTDASITWQNAVISGTGNDNAVTIDLDKNGNLFIGGSVSSGVWGAGQYDGFIAKINTATGAVIWDKRIGGTGSDIVQDITTDGNYVYAIGRETTDSYGMEDIYVEKIDVNGNFTTSCWRKKFGGVNQDEGSSIAIDGKDIYITGFQKSDYFSTTFADMFLIKLKRAQKDNLTFNAPVATGLGSHAPGLNMAAATFSIGNATLITVSDGDVFVAPSVLSGLSN